MDTGKFHITPRVKKKSEHLFQELSVNSPRKTTGTTTTATQRIAARVPQITRASNTFLIGGAPASSFPSRSEKDKNDHLVWNWWTSIRIHQSPLPGSLRRTIQQPTWRIGKLKLNGGGFVKNISPEESTPCPMQKQNNAFTSPQSTPFLTPGISKPKWLFCCESRLRSRIFSGLLDPKSSKRRKTQRNYSENSVVTVS